MKKFYFYGLFAFCCLQPQINAKLAVLADLGGESAVRFYEPIQPVSSPDAPQNPNAVPSIVTEVDMLPVVSHKWSVGSVQPQSVKLSGAMPIFLLGVDERSRQWLADNQQKLLSLRATGLVINVQTLDELNQLRAIAPSLTLLPSPADALADRLGINRYPLLITAEGISQ